MPPRVSDYERILRRALPCARGWPLDADPAGPGADRDRHHGSRLRGRFDSRSLRHHTGPIYCLYFKHLRDHRFGSLYFLLARLIDRFIYLQTGLAFILGFVGIKMIVADYYPISNWISFGVIVLVLAVTITISMIVTERRAAAGNRK